MMISTFTIITPTPVMKHFRRAVKMVMLDLHRSYLQILTENRIDLAKAKITRVKSTSEVFKFASQAAHQDFRKPKTR